MTPDERKARDPKQVGIEFPEGRRLRTSASHRRTGSSAFAFFAAGVLLGAIALGAGYWLGGRQGATTPPPTLEATVEMKGIKFVPDYLEVEVGTKVTWVNRDPPGTLHTVTSDEPGGPLNSGTDPSTWLDSGETYAYTFTAEGTYKYHCIPHAFLSNGVYRGMVGTIVVRRGGGGGGGGTPIDLDYTPRNASTAPLPPGPPAEWNFTIRARELFLPVGYQKPYAAWTFDGTIPGPVFRVRQGDRVNIRLINEGTSNHSIDFHSAQIDWATAYRDVAPGNTHVYSFTANYPGVYMYHCGSSPVLQHVANGMYGMMIVEPRNDTRPPADREYALVLSEFYRSDAVNQAGVYTGDPDKMLAAEPTDVAFNGFAFQYHPLRKVTDDTNGAPLPARPGERVRLYVLNAGPSIVQSFHVIGGIFDTVWIENNPANPIYGIQTWTLPASGGAAFDIVFPDPGLYPFVTHNFAYTGLGAIGVIAVT